MGTPGGQVRNSRSDTAGDVNKQLDESLSGNRCRGAGMKGGMGGVEQLLQ